MKNIFFVFVFAITMTLSSQNSLGFFAGASNSALTNGFLKEVYVDKTFGFHLGGVYEHELTKNISFRPKLVFSLQGDRKEGRGGAASPDDVDYKLSYLNIPLNFKFFSKPYIITGPQVGVLINTKKGTNDLGDVKSSLDYGVNFGIGYDFGNFFIEANAYQGIQPVLEVSGSKNNTHDVTNTVIQLSLGYFFN
ncbi:outer membrane beta-barrel protein [Seonamhaeicola sp. ML3]|uniref:outer membrane beta-barrel protein n=1 Tax=Seonamhaeicola sp. ML3 TaxID=2937786 RepID=UPI00200E4980|nr:outer membrane beta-barrel protein [Seonamhaeicola sp. ML3]